MQLNKIVPDAQAQGQIIDQARQSNDVQVLPPYILTSGHLQDLNEDTKRNDFLSACSYLSIIPLGSVES